MPLLKVSTHQFSIIPTTVSIFFWNYKYFYMENAKFFKQILKDKNGLTKLHVSKRVNL